MLTPAGSPGQALHLAYYMDTTAAVRMLLLFSTYFTVKQRKHSDKMEENGLRETKSFTLLPSSVFTSVGFKTIHFERHIYLGDTCSKSLNSGGRGGWISVWSGLHSKIQGN